MKTFFKKNIAKHIFPVTIWFEFFTGFSDIIVLANSLAGVLFASSLGVIISGLRLCYRFKINDYNEDVEHTMNQFVHFRDQIVDFTFKKVAGVDINDFKQEDFKQEDVVSGRIIKLKSIYHAVDTIILQYEADKEKNPAQVSFNRWLRDGFAGIRQIFAGFLRYCSRIMEQNTEDNDNEIVRTPYLFHFTKKITIYSSIDLALQIAAIVIAACTQHLEIPNAEIMMATFLGVGIFTSSAAYYQSTAYETLESNFSNVVLPSFRTLAENYANLAEEMLEIEEIRLHRFDVLNVLANHKNMPELEEAYYPTLKKLNRLQPQMQQPQQVGSSDNKKNENKETKSAPVDLPLSSFATITHAQPQTDKDEAEPVILHEDPDKEIKDEKEILSPPPKSSPLRTSSTVSVNVLLEEGRLNTSNTHPANLLTDEQSQEYNSSIKTPPASEQAHRSQPSWTQSFLVAWQNRMKRQYWKHWKNGKRENTEGTTTYSHPTQTTMSSLRK
jgi:hypothetical protein